jgi:thiamine biosynthesis protein ThiS
MKLFLNGQERDLAIKDIFGLLESLKLDSENLVIEHNGSIVPRGANVQLCHGDKIEIVSFVGGG